MEGAEARKLQCPAAGQCKGSCGAGSPSAAVRADSRHRLGPAVAPPNSHAHLCPAYLSHLFVCVSTHFVKQAVSSRCCWMSILEALTVTVGEGLGQRCVCFRVLSGHFRLIRQLSGSEQQCLCNFIPADWTKGMHTWSPMWDLPINRGGCREVLSSEQPPYLAAPFLAMQRKTVGLCRLALLPLWQMDFLHTKVHHKYPAKLLLCPMKLFPITFHFVSLPHHTHSITLSHGFMLLILQLSHAGFFPWLDKSTRGSNYTGCILFGNISSGLHHTISRYWLRAAFLTF